jgi:outer membrane protein OmpA-like peptidoglycan-associated protein
VAAPAPAPAPAPVAAPTPAPAAAPAQVAAAPAARAATDPIARLGFAAGGAELGADARPSLARVIEELQRDTAARLQLQAFASGGDDQGGQARRLSLSRALAVRGYLIEQGIASTRIDVRALGRASDGPPDRVDVLLIRR